MRIRKVKCDENRPACNRCTSTGRSCDGEIGAANLPIARSRPIAPRPSLKSKDVVIRPTQPTQQLAQVPVSTALDCRSASPSPQWCLPVWGSLSPGLSDYERHGFRHFQALTAPAMQIMLPSPEWVPVALQMSSQSLPVFHAIIATGTMGRSSAIDKIVKSALTCCQPERLLY